MLRWDCFPVRSWRDECVVLALGGEVRLATRSISKPLSSWSCPPPSLFRPHACGDAECIWFCDGVRMVQKNAGKRSKKEGFPESLGNDFWIIDSWSFSEVKVSKMVKDVLMWQAAVKLPRTWPCRCAAEAPCGGLDTEEGLKLFWQSARTSSRRGENGLLLESCLHRYTYIIYLYMMYIYIYEFCSFILMCFFNSHTLHKKSQVCSGVVGYFSLGSGAQVLVLAIFGTLARDLRWALWIWPKPLKAPDSGLCAIFCGHLLTEWRSPEASSRALHPNQSQLEEAMAARW